jgi:hypothetical protein
MVACAEVGTLRNTNVRAYLDLDKVVDPNILTDPAVLAD